MTTIYDREEYPFAVQSWAPKEKVWFDWSAHTTVEEAALHMRGIASEGSRTFRIGRRLAPWDAVQPCPFCTGWHSTPTDGMCLL